MVVIALIGILSAIATPNMLAWRQNRQFTSSIQRIVSIMHNAKLRAVKENTPTVIIFDKKHNNFKAFVECSNPPDFAWDANTDRQIELYDIPDGVKISDSTFTSLGDDKSRLVFNQRGTPANFNNGKVTLKSDRGLSSGIVVAVTGRIRVD